MVEPSAGFENNYQEYCAQLAKIDYASVVKTLGIERDGNRMFIPFVNT